MSEVQETIQIIEVSAKGLYWGARITEAVMMNVVKLMNTLYLAKWKGDTSLRRFQAIRGNEMEFFNIATENKKVLNEIYKSMERHGILIGKLPDLCGGDGRTQIVLSPCDMAKMQSFLLDHAHGSNKNIKIGPITAADYEQTGHNKKGITQEYQELVNSAKGNLEKSRLKAPESIPLQLEEKNAPNFPASNHEFIQMLSRVKQEESCRNEEAAKVSIKHEKSYCASNANWVLYDVKDGNQAVLIPKDHLMPKNERGYVTAIIERNQDYLVVDKANGSITRIKGKQVLQQLQREPIKIRLEKAENLVRHEAKIKKQSDRIKEMIR